MKGVVGTLPSPRPECDSCFSPGQVVYPFDVLFALLQHTDKIQTCRVNASNAPLKDNKRKKKEKHVASRVQTRYSCVENLHAWLAPDSEVEDEGFTAGLEQRASAIVEGKNTAQVTYRNSYVCRPLACCSVRCMCVALF